MPAARRGRLLTWFWRIHRWVYSVSGGRLGSRVLGRRALLLTTIGRKSGQPRSIALYYRPYEGGFVVVGSNAGDDRHSLWYLNLEAHPEAEVLAGWRRYRVVSRVAAGEERQRLWDQVVAEDSDYAEYQARTDRQIPIVILDPLPEPDQVPRSPSMAGELE